MTIDGSSGESKAIPNRHRGAMLPLGVPVARPNADVLTMLPGPVSQGRHHVTATTPMIIAGAISAPGTGTGATIEAEIDIVNRTGWAAGNLEPVGANLPNYVTVAFFLNLLGVSYGMCHCCPPLIKPIRKMVRGASVGAGVGVNVGGSGSGSGGSGVGVSIGGRGVGGSGVSVGGSGAGVGGSGVGVGGSGVGVSVGGSGVGGTCVGVGGSGVGAGGSGGGGVGIGMEGAGGGGGGSEVGGPVTVMKLAFVSVSLPPGPLTVKLTV